MNIYELIEWLGDQPDKERSVLIEGNGGWFTICGGDSGEEEVEGEKYFLLKPCYGHGDEIIEVDVKADDFDLESN